MGAGRERRRLEFLRRLSGLLAGFPAVVAVLPRPSPIASTGDRAKALGLTEDWTLPPHAADRAALQVGDLADLDTLDDVTVATEHELNIIVVE